jgi:hypothetical protein
MGRKIITLRYPATCRDCGAALQKGDRARYYGRGRVYGVDCHERRPAADMGEIEQARRERAREDMEYAQGVADAQRYLDDKRIYGSAMAEQWEMEAEMARYNRGEE